MTDELMAEVAQDYMQQMGLVNTPYIVVRHYDKAHPHCHIVFSRVDYDGKILTQTTNFKKNERVCKVLNLKHRLVQGKSKLNTDVSKLRGKEKSAISLSIAFWDSFSSPLSPTGTHTLTCCARTASLCERKSGSPGVSIFIMESASTSSGTRNLIRFSAARILNRNSRSAGKNSKRKRLNPGHRNNHNGSHRLRHNPNRSPSRRSLSR